MMQRKGPWVISPVAWLGNKTGTFPASMPNFVLGRVSGPAWVGLRVRGAVWLLRACAFLRGVVEAKRHLCPG